MITKTRFAPVVLAGLLCALPALGQGDSGKQPKAEATKTSLEEMLSKALKQNPDILVAQAKLREAEAELNRTRQAVLAKIVVLHAEIDIAKELFQVTEMRWKRVSELHSRGLTSDEEVGIAQAALQKAKAELARKQADLPLLIGKKVTEQAEHVPQGPDAPRAEANVLDLKSETAKRFQTALEGGVKVNFVNVPLEEVLIYLQSTIKTKGVNLYLAARGLGQNQVQATLAENVSLFAALQLLEDTLELRFIVREYGIVAVTNDSVPPGALSMTEFAKQMAKMKAPE